MLLCPSGSFEAIWIELFRSEIESRGIIKQFPRWSPATTERSRQAQLIDSQTIKGRFNCPQPVIPGRLLQLNCASSSQKDAEAHLTSDRWCCCLGDRFCAPVDRWSGRAQRGAAARTRCVTETPVSGADSSFSCSWFHEWSRRSCHYFSKNLLFYLPLRGNPHAHLWGGEDGSLQTSPPTLGVGVCVCGGCRLLECCAQVNQRHLLWRQKDLRRWCVRMPTLAFLLLFLALAQSAGLSGRVRLNVVMRI